MHFKHLRHQARGLSRCSKRHAVSQEQIIWHQLGKRQVGLTVTTRFAAQSRRSLTSMKRHSGFLCRQSCCAVKTSLCDVPSAAFGLLKSSRQYYLCSMAHGCPNCRQAITATADASDLHSTIDTNSNSRSFALRCSSMGCRAVSAAPSALRQNDWCLIGT